MLKFIQKKLKEEKGLTLIELLAVIVILGIIAAIAIPAIGNIIENSRFNAAKADFQNVLSAANIYFTETGDDTFTNTSTGVADFVDDMGSIQTFTVTSVPGGSNTIQGTFIVGDTTHTLPATTNAALSDMDANEFQDAATGD